jgi:hypothetical protein
LRQHERAAERQRKADIEAGTVKTADLSCRASAIFAVLSAARWQTVTELAAALVGSLAFRGPNGRRLSARSRLQAIRRELEKPELARLVVVETEREKHGWERQRITLKEVFHRLQPGVQPRRKHATTNCYTATASLHERNACAAAACTATAGVSLDKLTMHHDADDGRPAASGSPTDGDVRCPLPSNERTGKPPARPETGDQGQAHADHAKHKAERRTKAERGLDAVRSDTPAASNVVRPPTGRSRVVAVEPEGRVRLANGDWLDELDAIDRCDVVDDPPGSAVQ